MARYSDKQLYRIFEHQLALDKSTDYAKIAKMANSLTGVEYETPESVEDRIEKYIAKHNNADGKPKSAPKRAWQKEATASTLDELVKAVNTAYSDYIHKDRGYDKAVLEGLERYGTDLAAEKARITEARNKLMADAETKFKTDPNTREQYDLYKQSLDAYNKAVAEADAYNNGEEIYKDAKRQAHEWFKKNAPRVIESEIYKDSILPEKADEILSSLLKPYPKAPGEAPWLAGINTSGFKSSLDLDNYTPAFESFTLPSAGQKRAKLLELARAQGLQDIPSDEAKYNKFIEKAKEAGWVDEPTETEWKREKALELAKARGWTEIPSDELLDKALSDRGHIAVEQAPTRSELKLDPVDALIKKYKGNESRLRQELAKLLSQNKFKTIDSLKESKGYKIADDAGKAKMLRSFIDGMERDERLRKKLLSEDLSDDFDSVYGTGEWLSDGRNGSDLIFRRSGRAPYVTYRGEQTTNPLFGNVIKWYNTINPEANTKEFKSLSPKEQTRIRLSNPFKYFARNEYVGFTPLEGTGERIDMSNYTPLTRGKDESIEDYKKRNMAHEQEYWNNDANYKDIEPLDLSKPETLTMLSNKLLHYMPSPTHKLWARAKENARIMASMANSIKGHTWAQVVQKAKNMPFLLKTMRNEKYPLAVDKETGIILPVNEIAPENRVSDEELDARLAIWQAKNKTPEELRESIERRNELNKQREEQLKNDHIKEFMFTTKSGKVGKMSAVVDSPKEELVLKQSQAVDENGMPSYKSKKVKTGNALDFDTKLTPESELKTRTVGSNIKYIKDVKLPGQNKSTFDKKGGETVKVKDKDGNFVVISGTQARILKTLEKQVRRERMDAAQAARDEAIFEAADDEAPKSSNAVQNLRNKADELRKKFNTLSDKRFNEYQEGKLGADYKRNSAAFNNAPEKAEKQKLNTVKRALGLNKKPSSYDNTPLQEAFERLKKLENARPTNEEQKVTIVHKQDGTVSTGANAKKAAEVLNEGQKSFVSDAKREAAQRLVKHKLAARNGTDERAIEKLDKNAIENNMYAKDIFKSVDNPALKKKNDTEVSDARMKNVGHLAAAMSFRPGDVR